MNKFWEEVAGGNDKNLDLINFHKWLINNDQYIDVEVTDTEKDKDEIEIQDRQKAIEQSFRSSWTGNHLTLSKSMAWSINDFRDFTNGIYEVRSFNDLIAIKRIWNYLNYEGKNYVVHEEILDWIRELQTEHNMRIRKSKDYILA